MTIACIEICSISDVQLFISSVCNFCSWTFHFRLSFIVSLTVWPSSVCFISMSILDLHILPLICFCEFYDRTQKEENLWATHPKGALNTTQYIIGLTWTEIHCTAAMHNGHILWLKLQMSIKQVSVQSDNFDWLFDWWLALDDTRITLFSWYLIELSFDVNCEFFYINQFA